MSQSCGEHGRWDLNGCSVTFQFITFVSPEQQSLLGVWLTGKRKAGSSRVFLVRSALSDSSLNTDGG